MALSPPFDYSSILIGEEILYRTLLQQRAFAQAGQYGMTWGPSDQALLTEMYYRAQAMRSDFAIPPDLQNCVPQPPCPWDKNNDQLEASDIMPVMFKQVAGEGFAMQVLTRDDLPNKTGYNTGSVLFEYNNDQSALDPDQSAVFWYFEPVAKHTYISGLAIFRTIRNPGSIGAKVFDYLCNLV